MALPYDAFLRGPPNTPCHVERSAYVDEVGIMDQPPDPQVGNTHRVGYMHRSQFVLASMSCGAAPPPSVQNLLFSRR